MIQTELNTLCTRIKNNDPTLTRLNKSFSNLGDVGAKAIADALETNRTLTTLFLSSNFIDFFKGVKAIADALKTNKTLTTLNLNDNNIGDKGAQAIADALETNKTLRTLSLFYSNIGDVGAQAIADALKINKTLTTLNLESNNISTSLIDEINGSLAANKCETALSKMKTTEVKETPGLVLQELEAALEMTNKITINALPTMNEWIQKLEQNIEICKIFSSLVIVGILGQRINRQIGQEIPKDVHVPNKLDENSLTVATTAFKNLSLYKPHNEYYNMAQEALLDLYLDLTAFHDNDQSRITLCTTIATELAKRTYPSTTEFYFDTLLKTKKMYDPDDIGDTVKKNLPANTAQQFFQNNNGGRLDI